MNVILKIKQLENSKNIRHLYDLVMVLLAAIAISTYIVETQYILTDDSAALIQKIDFYIWLIFTFDYVTRFLLAQNKKEFAKNNIVELLALIPFDSVFQGLRAIRILRVLRMLKLFVYLNRVYKRFRAVFKTNDFHYVLWFTCITIFCGAGAISTAEGMDLGDALWWSFVTTTTVGYGDIAPSSLFGRITAVFLMIIGIGFLSMLTATVATYFIGANKESYKNTAIQQIATQLRDFHTLSVEDINNIHSVLIALKKNEKP